MPVPRRNLSFTLGVRASRSLLLSIAVLSCAYLFFCTRSFRAEQLARSARLDDLIRATQLEPDNAMNWQRLGLARLYQQDDPDASLPAFQRALQLNPHDSDSWIGTSYALQFLNRQAEERVAIGRALKSEPKRLDISWQAANLYAVLGDRDLMINQICELLQHDRRRSQAALDLAAKITGSSTLDCGQHGNRE